jgi:hypothetical protein
MECLLRCSLQPEASSRFYDNALTYSIMISINLDNNLAPAS